MTELIEIFRQNPLFNGLEANLLRELAHKTIQREYAAGEMIVEEDSPPDFLYILEEGEAEVLKKEAGTGQEFSVSTIHTGESIGEMCLIDQGKRSATVRAIKNSKILLLPIAEVKNHSQIISNLTNILTARLRRTNDITVKSLQAQLDIATRQAESGRFLFSICIVLSTWSFFVSLIKSYVGAMKHSTPFTLIFMLVLLGFCIHFIKKSNYPLSDFGLTLRNWKKNTIEAILFSLPILLLATVLKWYLVAHVETYQNYSLFKYSFAHPESTFPIYLPIILIFAYVIFTPIQELIARGATQTALSFSLPHKHNHFWAIILSNLIFAAYHAHLSIVFSLIAFIAGLFWGWMFYRQKSLLGPSISHALIGGYILSLLGFDEILLLML